MYLNQRIADAFENDSLFFPPLIDRREDDDEGEACTSSSKISFPIVDRDDPASAHFMALTMEPSSEAALAFTNAVADAACKAGGGKYRASKPFIHVAGAVLSDLMYAATAGVGGYAYRSVATDSFANVPVNAVTFRKVIEGLGRIGYIERTVGRRTLGVIADDRASTFRPTSSLLSVAASYGVEPADWAAHFTTTKRRPKKVRGLVQLRSKSTKTRGKHGDKIPGRHMEVDLHHPTVVESARKLVDYNAFLTTQRLENCQLYGLRRQFNDGDVDGHDYARGGRLYGIGRCYQNDPKTDRHTYRINGEPVVELDTMASHAVILAGLAGEPMPAGFSPYDGTAFDRDFIKLFVAQTIGGTGLAIRWSKETSDEYRETKAKEGIFDAKLHEDVPFKELKEAACRRWPLLARRHEFDYDWGDLQFKESEVLLETIHTLATKHGILALPLHDAIIVAQSNAKVAKQVYEDTFHRVIGCSATIRCK